MKQMIILLAAFVSFPMMAAQIHKWIDKNGNVHYGEKPKDGTESEIVRVSDKYLIPYVDALDAIRYSEVKPHRPVALVDFKFEMPGQSSGQVRIGRIPCTEPPIDLYWTDGVVQFENAGTAVTVADTFNENGYVFENALGGAPSGGSLHLNITIRDMKFNYCFERGNKKSQKAGSYLLIEWELIDPLQRKTIFKGKTKGANNSFDQGYRLKGIDISAEQSLQMATRNLLADQNFVKHLVPTDLKEMKESFGTTVRINYSYGLANTSFNRRVDELKANSVTVKVDGGHGSGVVLDEKGHVLTNAHVVGDHTKFRVSVNNRTYDAVLIRKENIRDVAILRIEDHNSDFAGVNIARLEPDVGDDIFIIGTPLNVGLEHTVTKGIISARRELNNLPFFQTDASINSGNSGGPVFNSKGELVALSVSGLFTRGGASLNINYLIPINDAIESLNIETESTMAELTKQLEGKTVVEGTKTLLMMIDEWLDEPVIKLF
ncbi:MAG: trypsin-like peptidase domain-containing protein [Gammaproteobacteria bacterium]|nr:trypsin-like peptidase domain-containing protein [Gammaproteobacteria bacterium]